MTPLGSMTEGTAGRWEFHVVVRPQALPAGVIVTVFWLSRGAPDVLKPRIAGAPLSPQVVRAAVVLVW